MKELDKKNHYNTHLVNFMPEVIPYDKKVYESVGAYIQDNLWKHMDKDRVKKVVIVLDDPTREYDDDIVMIKQLLKSFLPTVKKALKIDTIHPLKDHIKINIENDQLFGRLIQQQLNLYRQKRNSGGLLTRVFQEGPQKNYIDANQPIKKELISDKIPQTQKTIIANILVFMILEEELGKLKS